MEEHKLKKLLEDTFKKDSPNFLDLRSAVLEALEGNLNQPSPNTRSGRTTNATGIADLIMAMDHSNIILARKNANIRSKVVLKAVEYLVRGDGDEEQQYASWKVGRQFIIGVIESEIMPSCV